MRNIQSSSTVNKMTVRLIIVVLTMLTAPAISNLMNISVVAEINPPPSGEGQIHYHSGDWVIETGDNIYRRNQTIVLKGNLTILGGTLTFQNVTLMMNSTKDGEFEINVTADGRFSVYNSNITAFDKTTPVVHYPGEVFEYTTYGLRYRFRVYGNMTIEDSNVSYMGGEELYGGSPYKGGIEIYSDEVIIRKNHIFNNENWTGIYCYQASPIITNNNISNNEYGLWFISSGGQVLYNNVISNQFGIRCEWCESSSPTITKNNITSNFNGIVLVRSNTTVPNNYIINNYIGMLIQDSNPYIANNTVENNEFGMYFNTPTNGIIINNTIKENTDRGIWLSGSANPVIVNSTIENNGYDLWILGSFPTTLNTTFDDSKLWMDSFSTLTVRNYLHVLVLNSATTPILGADINVTDNKNPIYQTPGFGGSDPQTDADGFIRWMVVTDRIYIGSSTATENTTKAEVKYPMKTFIDNPRDVNMSKSHIEIFIETGGVLLPDLRLTKNDISFNPPSPVKDKTLVTINATVHNTGLEDAFNVVVRFYDGVPPTNLIGEDQITSIAALGGVGWAGVDWTATPFGTHNIYVTIDPDGMIAESNETNNIENKTIGVGIPLYEGWNLISIPYIQTDTDLGSVLDSIDGAYYAVWRYNVSNNSDLWRLNHSLKPPYMIDLHDLDHKMGFWIHITQPGETIFVFNGMLPPENQSVALYPGWNLVGYPSLSNKNRTTALNNLDFGTDVDSIWSYNAVLQEWEEIKENDYFKVGRGYWIYSNVEKVWYVPL